MVAAEWMEGDIKGERKEGDKYLGRFLHRGLFLRPLFAPQAFSLGMSAIGLLLHFFFFFLLHYFSFYSVLFISISQITSMPLSTGHSPKAADLASVIAS